MEEEEKENNGGDVTKKAMNRERKGKEEIRRGNRENREEGTYRKREIRKEITKEKIIKKWKKNNKT